MAVAPAEEVLVGEAEGAGKKAISLKWNTTVISKIRMLYFPFLFYFLIYFYIIHFEFNGMFGNRKTDVFSFQC